MRRFFPTGNVPPWLFLLTPLIEFLFPGIFPPKMFRRVKFMCVCVPVLYCTAVAIKRNLVGSHEAVNKPSLFWRNWGQEPFQTGRNFELACLLTGFTQYVCQRTFIPPCWVSDHRRTIGRHFLRAQIFLFQCQLDLYLGNSGRGDDDESKKAAATAAAAAAPRGFRGIICQRWAKKEKRLQFQNGLLHPPTHFPHGYQMTHFLHPLQLHPRLLLPFAQITSFVQYYVDLPSLSCK